MTEEWRRVRDAVAAGAPGYHVETVVRLGEGLENVAYVVNDTLIVRFAKDADVARRVDREERLLAVVAEVATVPVPAPRFVLAERGCIAYDFVSGRPLLEYPRREWAAHAPAIGATLSGLLGAVQAVPLDRVAGLVEVDDQPLDGWLADAAELYEAVRGAVPAAHRKPVEAFLRAAPPPRGDALVFSHNDLGMEHVLVDPDTWWVTGVIDWSDAAIVDPAYDVGLLLRDLGPAAVGAGVGREVRERAEFYARCSLFEDLTYGLDGDKPAYAEKCLEALEWLFPVG